MKKLSDLFEECLSQDYSNINNASFAVKENGGELSIYFEASNGGVDWIRNLDFPAEPYRKMDPAWHAHRGFIRTWRYVLPYLEEYRDSPKISSVRIVGYSHGAALAVLAHEDFYFHRPDLHNSLFGVGFAPPRVVAENTLSPELSRRWENFTTVWNLGDLVPMLPPAFLGYTHVGRILQIGELGKYTPIDAHRPESYLAELRQI